jgi:hypothetical protein
MAFERSHVIALGLPLCAVCAVSGYLLGSGSDRRAQERLESTLFEQRADLHRLIDRHDQRAQGSAERLERLIMSISPPRDTPFAIEPTPPAAKPPADESTSPVGAPEKPGDPVALASAEKAIDDAFDRKTWDETDAIALRVALSNVASGERERLVRKLIVAANSGQLKVSVHGPLF